MIHAIKKTNQNYYSEDTNEVYRNDYIKIENDGLNKEKAIIYPISSFTSKVETIKNDKNDSGYISQSKNYAK